MATKSAKTINITPLGDRVLVQRVEEAEQTLGGIIIPDSAKEKPQTATVVALGTGARDEDGNLQAFDVSVGDTVLIGKYAGTEVKYDEETYLLLNESDILAIIR